ncbi:hypothetical protein QFC22_004555 [Naganishia vaughanmartiniae]|uniref:Uncharacterized protein n=1 Tax=Naganishia vaughanmartiniae TaxID=1424756 RepID=A0ACC2WZK5_9TREE|nr:hypothetical protein QFC22_004555 [Naganishia vaughanmartiniae]
MNQILRDMLETSIPSFNEEHHIPVSESSQDFRIMLLIITGRPQDVLGRPPTSWDHVVRLYRPVDKYRLDGHQHWFSQLCAEEAAKTPVQALIMACGQPIIDITLARYAIAEGFSKTTTSKMHDPDHFDDAKSQYESSGVYRRVAHMLDASNMKLRFRIKLGFKGSMAYSHIFEDLASVSVPNWNDLANHFVANARYIEYRLDKSIAEQDEERKDPTASARDTVACTSLPYTVGEFLNNHETITVPTSIVNFPPIGQDKGRGEDLLCFPVDTASYIHQDDIHIDMGLHFHISARRAVVLAFSNDAIQVWMQAHVEGQRSFLIAR